ncbi:MAG: Asp-tRNA(Asn)/Glu-tRNA(Gln) amidotransferase subunit GatC [Candidatus Andersenbacteria bacterium]|nr:Asp-tRNA(Asn)/Glu-tRNA(Gln) amidotransferase subunit GatC [Candidatus Andersenbacteria bacterium]
MSPIISEQDIEKVAKLSRLGLTAEKVKKATQDVGNVLSHFSAIQAIDVKDAPSTDGASGLKNVTRADEVGQLGSPQDLLAAVPQTHQGQIKVSAVFE